ncbi:NAD(P)-binding domain-containing protein [Streptomyces sp. NBC_01450]|uniref:NAD(P)-binding domain-containing protein n=1 Tax=Streptomyces sp. NBC_01450 TaxID=2903871 RepID=UPI003FCD3D11
MQPQDDLEELTRNVGLLGAGAMGSAIARRLLAHSHDVVAWNRSPAPLAELVEAGARPAAAPGEAVGAPCPSRCSPATSPPTHSRPMNTSSTPPAGACLPCAITPTAAGRAACA